MLDSLSKFYQNNKEWLNNLLSGGIALLPVVIGVIWGGVWWYRQQRRQSRIIQPSLPFQIIPHNGNVLPIIYKRDETDKDPLADHNISYQRRIHEQDIRKELCEKLEQHGWLLIVGQTGLGKTREAAEVAQHFNREGWTVLILKLGQWLERPTGEQPEVIGTDRKLLFFLDDLNQYCQRSEKLEQNPQAKDSPLAAINIPLQERLLETLEYYETHCTRAEEVRVIATARNETEPEKPGQPSEWEKLKWDKYPQLWKCFEVFELPQPEDGAIVELLQDTVSKTNIQHQESDYPAIASRNDCTFRNVVENLIRLRNRNLSLEVKQYTPTLKGTWEERYQEAVKRYLLAKYVYEAVDLLRQCNVSLEAIIVEPTARMIAQGNLLQKIWYRWRMGRTLRYLRQREQILTPRDGQIEAKGRQVDLTDYLHSLSKLIWQLTDRYPARMLASLNGFTLKLYNLKLYRDALTGCNKLVKIAPEVVENWLYRGDICYFLEQYDEAITSCDQAVAIKADYHQQVWNNRGIALGNLGRYDEAILSYDRAIALKADDHQAWYNRGSALGNLGRYDEEIDSYERVIALKADDHQAWYNRGIALGNLGRYDEAILSYDRAIALKADDHQAWNNRGVVLGNLGRYDKAIASYDRAVAIKLDYHEAWNNRGIALRNLGRYEGASASYDRAVDIKPDYHGVWYNQGNALYSLVRYEEAIASYDRAIAIKPDYHEAILGKATCYAMQGDRETFQQLLQTLPPDFLNNLMANPNFQAFLNSLNSTEEG